MSRTNPQKAIDAILPLPISVGRDLTVRPMTLGMYAALERIGSPLVTGAPVKDTLELIPSLYLLTHDPREIFRGNLLDLALQWAETVPVAIVGLIRKAAYRQISALTDVVPELSEEEKKNGAPTTAGSPTTRPSRRKPSAGATAKSYGKSRPRPSRSSSASKTAPSATPSRSLK